MVAHDAEATTMAAGRPSTGDLAGGVMMRRLRWPRSLAATALLPLLLLGSLASEPARGAEILLDEPLRLGDVVVFPSRSDPNKYYYAPVTARLAQRPDGKAQFSFLRWVDNQRSQAGEADIREGEGGGLVHAVVTLGLSDERFATLRERLQAERANATLEGPVVYNQGTFALVTSFTEENSDLVRRVLVGTGRAPVLDGSKAAISLLLTRTGAEILWESFHSGTPDISFLFEMELEGYRSPKEAVLEADFDQVYKHRSFQENLGAAASADVGVAVPVDKIAAAFGAPIPVPIDVGVSGHLGGVFKAEIDRAFEELRQNGSIRIQFVGEDEDLKKVIDDAYTSLRDMIFEPSFATPDGRGLQGRSVRSRAADVPVVVGRPPGAAAAPTAGADPTAALAAAAASASEAAAAPPTAPTAGSADGAKSGKKKAPKGSTAPGSAEPGGPKTSESGVASPQPAASGRDRENSQQSQAAADRPTPGAPKIGASPPGCSGYPSSGVGGGSGGGAGIQLAVAVDLCASVKYQLKRKRHSGTYRMDLRKYTASKLLLPFAENIGDLREHLEDDSMFRSVNLDDPLYKQREISAQLSSIRIDDFESYLNSAAVMLRKRHQSGESTFDEARIDRANFNRTGNDFKLLYGWKGDADRDVWNQYEYRALWSFAGGNRIETDWIPASFNVIPLDPPFQRREIRLEGSPELLANQPVRSITVRLYYPDAAGAERTDQVTLRTDQGDLSRLVEILVPVGTLAYDYEISWRLRGNRSLTTGRQTTTEDVLYVDELPEA
jgi:hypothetical protein